MALEIPHPRVADDKQTQNLDRLKPWADEVDAFSVDLQAQIEALPQGVLGVNTLTASFTTTGTHTTAQDEGLSVTCAYQANRRLKVTLKANPYASGGTNTVQFLIYRGATLVAVFTCYPTGIESMCWTACIDGPAIAATETFKVQLQATTNNTAVQSYADSTFTRQLIIEDIGPQ
jgi:hypothetical protein